MAKKAQKKHNVIKGLIKLLVAVGELKNDPANARKHDERNVQSIANSLKEFGQRKPIVINRKDGNVILAGNGTLEAAKRLGWTHIAGVFVEDDPDTATGYAIADNRTSELATWDNDQLSVLLRSIYENEEIKLAVGFSEDEISKLCAVTDMDGPGTNLAGDITNEDQKKDLLKDNSEDGPNDNASHVRMVQLFLSEDNVDDFMRKVMELAKHHEKANVTDTIVQIVNLSFEDIQ